MLRTSWFLAVAVAAPLLAPVAVHGSQNLVIVFDGSGSMAKPIEGKTRIEVAREALAGLVADLPASYQVGLVAYGHRRQRDCSDIEVLGGLERLDRGKITEKIASIRPQGNTPIGAALRQAGELLAAAPEGGSILLLTDGEENCGGEPGRVAAALQRDRGIPVHVVGFEILEQQEAEAVRDIASQGKGVYQTAATIEALVEALDTAIEVVEGRVTSIDSRVQENTEILLDLSTSMGLELDPRSPGGPSRLEAARRAVGRVLGKQTADRERLAYREFGGPCPDASRLRVAFDLNNSQEIRSKLDDSAPAGSRTLVRAIMVAAGDFEGEQFEGVNRRVVVITGGIDDCVARSPSDLLSAWLAGRQVQATFDFIGVGIHPKDWAEFQAIANAVGGTVQAVTTEEQLEKALEYVFEFEPVIRNLYSMLDVLGSSINELQGIIPDLNQRDFAAAQDKIATAEANFRETARRFRDLGRRRGRDEFTRAFELAKALRERQQLMTQKMDVGARAGREDNWELHNQMAGEYNVLRGQYAQDSAQLNQLLQEIRQFLESYMG